MSPRCLTVAALILSGCQIYQDPGVSTDAAAPTVDAAAPAPDADPSCAVWQRASPVVEAVTVLDAAPLRVGRSARFEIALLGCPGDAPGPIYPAQSFEGSYLSFLADGWARGPACARPTEASTRIITAQIPWPGTWQLGTATGFTILEVGPVAPGACGSAPRDACERDCDCEGGEQCLTGASPDGPVQRCARACEVDRECLGAGRCGSADGLDQICVPGPECADDRPCPDGFDCQAGTCAPTFELNGGTRHACGCDADCDQPMRCVYQPTLEDPTRKRCEITCPSQSPGWCEGPHTCGLGGIEIGTGVCEWVGD